VITCCRMAIIFIIYIYINKKNIFIKKKKKNLLFSKVFSAFFDFHPFCPRVFLDYASLIQSLCFPHVCLHFISKNSFFSIHSCRFSAFRHTLFRAFLRFSRWFFVFFDLFFLQRFLIYFTFPLLF
jgi:hypothetical protein